MDFGARIVVYRRGVSGDTGTLGDRSDPLALPENILWDIQVSMRGYSQFDRPCWTLCRQCYTKKLCTVAQCVCVCVLYVAKYVHGVSYLCPLKLSRMNFINFEVIENLHSVREWWSGGKVLVLNFCVRGSSPDWCAFMCSLRRNTYSFKFMELYFCFIHRVYLKWIPKISPLLGLMANNSALVIYNMQNLFTH